MTDPDFGVATTENLTSSHVSQLASGRAAAVRISGLLRVEDCRRAIESLERVPMDLRDPSMTPTPIRRIGPALSDYRTADGGFAADEYWPAAETARIEWLQARIRPDVMAIVLGKLGADWGEALLPATIGGRPVFGPTVQQADDGTPPHVDAVWQDFANNLFDQEIASQFSLAVMLEAPQQGGGLSIWQRRWELSHEELRIDGAYGYADELVGDARRVVIPARIGEGVLINTACYHSLEPVAEGRRIVLGMFMALTVSGQLIVWS